MEIWKIFVCVLNHIWAFYLLSQFISLVLLNLELKPVSKFWVTKIYEFSILGIEQKWKLGNFGNFSFFLLNHIGTFEFFAQLMLLSFLNLENSTTSKFFIFLLKPYRDLLVFEHLSNCNFFIIKSCSFLHLEFLLVN